MKEKEFFSGEDLPPLDIRFRTVRGLFGIPKKVRLSPGEQRAVKMKLMKKYPDRLYLDDLGEDNSVSPEGEDDWVDEMEMFDAIFDD